MRRSIVAGVVMVVAGCASDGAPAGREDRMREALAAPHVSLADGVRAAEASVPGALTERAALRVDDDPVYVVRTAARDVRVALTDGAVLGATDVAGPSTTACPGSIPLADALLIAEGAVSGTAVAVVPDDDTPCDREVQVLAGPTLWEVKVAPDGTLAEPPEVSDEDEP